MAINRNFVDIVFFMISMQKILEIKGGYGMRLNGKFLQAAALAVLIPAGVMTGYGEEANASPTLPVETIVTENILADLPNGLHKITVPALLAGTPHDLKCMFLKQQRSWNHAPHGGLSCDWVGAYGLQKQTPAAEPRSQGDQRRPKESSSPHGGVDGTRPPEPGPKLPRPIL